MKRSCSVIFCSLLFFMLFILTVSAGAALHVQEPAPGEFVVVDTDTNLMWLMDADMSGQKDWYAAYNWADTLVYGGYSDWRLPATLDPDPSCNDGLPPAYGYGCTGSEMGYLFNISLGGNITGIFDDIQTDTVYWSGTKFPDNYGWEAYYYFSFNNGYQNGWGYEDTTLHAWAVRVVPEPVSSVLFIAGGSVLGFRRFRKRNTV